MTQHTLLRCVGPDCGAVMPEHETLPHSQSNDCTAHSKHTPTGWTACRHDGRCFEPVATDEGIAA